MKVIINGTDYYFFDGSTISYEHILELAGYGPKRVITVVFSSKSSSGDLFFGQEVDVVEGLVINAVNTGNA